MSSLLLFLYPETLKEPCLYISVICPAKLELLGVCELKFLGVYELNLLNEFLGVSPLLPFGELAFKFCGFVAALGIGGLLLGLRSVVSFISNLGTF